MPTLPSVTGTKSRSSCVAVSYRRMLTRQGYRRADSPRASAPFRPVCSVQAAFSAQNRLRKRPEPSKGRGVELGLGLRYQRWREGEANTIAVAIAAMPSPRPVSPSPSVVVAVTDTDAITAVRNASSASRRRGPSLGRLPMICMAMLPITKPALVTILAACASNVTPGAPASSVRSVPKWVPRSPSPAAEKRASQAAWAATSPSEWPASPRSPGQVSPARDNARSSSANECTSTPIPMRGSGFARETRPVGGCGLIDMGAIVQQRRGDGEVEGGGDLEGPAITVYDPHVSPDPLDEPGIIGGVASAGVGMLEHLTQEPLRGLDATKRLAIGSRHDATLGVDHLDRCLLYTSPS